MSDVRPEWYLLRDALERADFQTASVLLQRNSRLVDERNGIGETVLHFLAVENNQPAIEWLHARGADLNPTNEFGTPLLFEVAQLGYRNLFVWLIEHGADPNKRTTDGQSVEEHLSEFDSSEMLDFIREQIARRLS